jgi:hypothetical protein
LKPPPLAGAGAGADNRAKGGREGGREGGMEGGRGGAQNMFIYGKHVMLMQYNICTYVRIYSHTHTYIHHIHTNTHIIHIFT